MIYTALIAQCENCSFERKLLLTPFRTLDEIITFLAKHGWVRYNHRDFCSTKCSDQYLKENKPLQAD